MGHLLIQFNILIKNMPLELVAVGVETDSGTNLAAPCGCEHVQG